MELKEEIIRRAAAAKRAAYALANISTEIKNKALLAMADALQAGKDDILFKNEIDVEAAKEAGLSAALIDRLSLTEARIAAMIKGLQEMAGLKDPVGEVLLSVERPNGLKINKVRVPLGVIGIIYESRPNVTVDTAGLCLKSGNAVILRGGSEAVNSNHILAKTIAAAAYATGIPEGAIQFIETTDRQAVLDMVKLDKFVDVIIPRGGEELIQFIKEHSTIPVISHGKGVCHTYVDIDADLKMAEEICFNAKVQRPGVCNAMETLLVHNGIALEFLPQMAARFTAAKVELRGDEKTLAILKGIKLAAEEDWSEEYLDLILSVKIVDTAEEAVAHINKFGSHHSETIVTKNKKRADEFMRAVDSAAVYWNASTRFTDGGEFGMGAEIGISTQKMHARGPMGLNELCSYKYMIYGNGQTRK
ncbi:MAG: glutamate-5-semialdehyde dehydrogenase [bacterium]|nr:glutamate-5-semialdehyde dehydrogenase [bacterium]MDD5755671.1 glutamate-5-semialdehyde dehydrogenase [bacterium]